MAIDRMGKGRPVGLGEEDGDSGLDGLGRIPFLKTKAKHDPEHMGVDNYPRTAEASRKDEIGRFSSHSRETKHGLHGFRQLSSLLLREDSRCFNEVTGFCVKEADAVYDLLYLEDVGLGHSRRVGPSFEEPRADAVHLFVGALGRQHHGAEELETSAVLEEGFGIGPQRPKNFQNPFGPAPRNFHIVHGPGL